MNKPVWICPEYQKRRVLAAKTPITFFQALVLLKRALVYKRLTAFCRAK